MMVNKLRRLALDGDLAAMQAIVIHLEQVEKERDDLRAAMLCMERPPYEIIGKILTEVMDIAVSNGADAYCGAEGQAMNPIATGPTFPVEDVSENYFGMTPHDKIEAMENKL